MLVLLLGLAGAVAGAFAAALTAPGLTECNDTFSGVAAACAEPGPPFARLALGAVAGAVAGALPGLLARRRH